jgi:hypothetical protein
MTGQHPPIDHDWLIERRIRRREQLHFERLEARERDCG